MSSLVTLVFMCLQCRVTAVQVSVSYATRSIFGSYLSSAVYWPTLWCCEICDTAAEPLQKLQTEREIYLLRNGQDIREIGALLGTVMPLLPHQLLSNLINPAVQLL